MANRTRRCVAFLCVICMLFTSMPSSVLSDTLPATPTDIQVTEPEEPAGEQAGNPGEETGDPAGGQSGEPSGETPGDPAGDPSEDPSGEEAGEPAGEPAGDPSENPAGEPAGDPSENPAGDPAEEPAGEQPAAPAEENNDEPSAEEPQQPAEEPTGEESAEEPEEEPEEKDKIPANRELAIGDDVTITGELTGEKPADYLIRFSTDVNQIMFAFLRSDKELTATVTDEETGKVIKFERDETARGGTITLTVEYTKFKSDRTYLVRISATEEASFSLRLVKKSILAKELEAQQNAEQPADEQPADEQPADEQPADEQPADEQPADEQPADEQPADEQPADEQPADEQPADEQPVDEQPADEQPADEQPADEQPADEQPADEQPADEQPADEEPVDEQPADEQPADEQPADEQPADEEPADEQPVDEQPADEQPTDEEPVDEQPADEQPADEELTEEEIVGEELTEEELTDEEITEEELTEEELTEEEPGEEETEETPATPTDLEPVEVRLDAAESGVEAWITFMSDAGIPEGAELHVRELDVREQAAYQEQTAQALNCDDESYLRYTKYLEFTLTLDGEALELNVPVTAYVTLPDVSEGLEALQVVRFGGAAPELMDSERNGDTFSFGTDSFAVFGIGNALISITAHETELAAVEVLGFSPDAPVSLTKTEDPEVEEGLEVLGTFTIENNTDAASVAAEDGLFIKAELKQDAELDAMEGVALYRVDEDGNTDVLMEELSGDARIMELDAQQVAVVKDTGYRHLTLTVNPEGTEEAQSITLDGMMPKGAEAAAEDVTDRFSDYVSPEARAEGEQPEENVQAAPKAAALRAAAPKAAAPETVQESEEAASSGTTTLAAYEISISHGDGEYQPDEDKPISVEIVDSRITAGGNIEVWHIRDDGTEEKVENFTLEEGKITFEATGFSVYVVIDHENETVVAPRVVFHFIADGADEETDGTDSTAYYIGDPYWFTNKKGDDQTTQILSNGESLELIKDPNNENNRYFFGWYVVEPYTGSGSTDVHGIAANGQLYYTWTAAPQYIAFEMPITIDKSNVNIGDTIIWTLNGVTGSGKVDSDGNVHVFVAPVFENYNFINFMLYPYDEDENNTIRVNNVMTRKLIPRGSSTQTDVKISDIRANSSDPVHLIFTGWEYNAGTVADPDWREFQTVSYTGEELTKDGRDGVYLDVDLEDTTHIDLYPIFIEARWVDYFAGGSDSGAAYVASCFRESWGLPGNPPEGMTSDPGKNVFTTMNVSTRAGYDFEGWYAFAVLDEDTGEILNLNEPMDVTVSYIDIDHKYTTHDVTVHTTAVKITNADGSIAYNGNCCLTPGGTFDSSGYYPLFGASGGELKLFDALDRLPLSANWTPGDTQITVIYWTENEQDKDYVAPDPENGGNEKDDYTASSVKVITTDELNTQSDTIGASFASGSTITLEQLALYQDNSVGVLDAAYLDEAGAVLAGEEKFYDRKDALSDSTVVIKGDGSTVINVYYTRMTFKLVFHIGRDGFVKQNGQQKPAFMTQPEYQNWDGNWIQFMFNDAKISNSPDDPNNPGLGYTPGPTASSYRGVFGMRYNGRLYTSEYVTDPYKVKGDYVPSDSENVYVITAKYGAYIGDRWPSPVNNAFTFTEPQNETKRAMYIWAGYYGSLYCRIANERVTYGNSSGNNPDINGIYEYMSAELCSNRAGTDVINGNHVHHLVAWFGDKGKAGIDKHYHIYYAAIEGTYDPEEYPVTEPGSDYLSYPKTTWCSAEGKPIKMEGNSFYKVADVDVISNLEPEYQLASNIDGYELVYSCYLTPHTNDHHIYFFYIPKQYTLTFNFGSTTENDTYYYTQTLANADKYTDDVVVPEGHYFKGWYTNTAGAGEPFDFAHETMPSQNVVLYPIVRVIQYTVKADPNGGVLDHRANRSHSTYFTADYGEPVGEYTTTRGYIKLTDRELDSGDTAHYYGGTKYYYINTQRLGVSSEGDWGLPDELRNAVYVAEDQIDAYYNWYSGIIDDMDTSWWTGVEKLSKQAFLDTYASKWYRPVEGGEHYTFMGWYQVYSNGSVASMPYNFNTPTTGPLELRALWRLDGGYYIQYVPTYYVDEGNGNVTAIVGQMEQWTDPDTSTSPTYADQAPTNILQAPTLPQGMMDEWVFRGWRIVRPNGEQPYSYQDGSGTTISDTYPIWEPMQRVDPDDSNSDPVYYQPGDTFIIDSDYVSAQGDFGGIIYMQAYYEPLDNSHRRPYITNLILDANPAYGGYVNTTDRSKLPALSGPGTSDINTDSNPGYLGNPTQILLGDFQSNIALHLYEYATDETFGSITGANLFSHKDGYMLIGFDDRQDPIGHHYIPLYAPDSVIAVTRNEQKTIYAMWEPMIYVTFVNDTDGDITIDLTGTTTDVIHIVNQVTGKFDREQVEDTEHLVIQAHQSVKIVLPEANVGEDSITATVVNEHLRKKMSVNGVFGETDPYGTGHTDIPYGDEVIYTGDLVTDRTGIVVTYTEIDDAQLVYDVNGGTWTDGEPYEHRGGNIYILDMSHVTGNDYEPNEPFYTDRMFIGWTTYPEIAEIHDFSSSNPLTVDGETVPVPDGSIQLDVVRDNYLWKFSRDPYDLYHNNETLYAVWSDTVTVTFNVAYSNSMTANPLKLHTWNGSDTTDTPGPYVFYRESDTSPYITYTMAKGEYILMPEDPTAHSDKPTWSFIRWLKNNGTSDKYRYTAEDKANANLYTYAFDFAQRVTTDWDVSTSWTSMPSQTFTFLVENEVIDGSANDEFVYTIAVSDVEFVAKKNGNNTVLTPDEDKVWGSFETTLKSGGQYTVRVTVYTMKDGWTGYNNVVDVIDKDGVVVKTGRLTRRTGQSKDGFTSDYKYTLTISQAPKTGYETNVGIVPNSQYGTVENPLINGPDAPDNSFTFYSCMFNSTNATGSLYTLYANTFTPVQNIYNVNSLTNGLTIKFTNTGSGVVAPTGFTRVTHPFVLMLLAGLLLLTGIAVPAFIRKRRHVKAEACEAVQINHPGTMPPCPRANLWTQQTGSSGKRGGTV